jgi:predicted Zn-dependent peptidase
MRRHTRQTAGFLILCGLSFASASAEQLRLSNGLLVIVEPRLITETVAVRLVIAGGDLGELSGRASLARLHAALLLRGSGEKSGFALARAAEELGGRLTAFSRLLAESVSLSLPAENAEAGLRLLATILLAPRLDAEDLQKEKNLLASSLATERDEPSTFRRDDLYRALFPNHPLQRLALPTAEDVVAVRIEDVRRFQASRLEAGRLALVVVGRCAPSRIAALAEELFGKIPTGREASGKDDLVARLPPPAPLPADVSRHVHKRTTQPEISVALPTEGISDAETPAYVLLRHILGGFQERLYSEIREKRGWAYWVSADGLLLPRAGYFAVTTGGKKEHLQEVERLIRAELARVASVPVSAEELARAVAYLRTEEARRDATNEGRVSVLVEELVAGAPLRAYEERIAGLSAVKPADIQALAHRLFANRHVAVVTLY